MSPETLLTYLVTYLRWFLAGIFLFAGITKARNLLEFATTIQLFRLVPGRLSKFIIAMLINVIRHNIMNCNCFGPYFKEQIGTRSIIRNVLLLLLIPIVVVFYDGFFALEFLLTDRGGLAPSHSVPLFVLLTTVMSLIAILVLVIRQLMATAKLMKAKR